MVNPEEWSAERLAMQVVVWQMVYDGAVRGEPLAGNNSRNTRASFLESTSSNCLYSPLWLVPRSGAIGTMCVANASGHSQGIAPQYPDYVR